MTKNPSKFTSIVMLCYSFIAAAKRDKSVFDIFDWCGAVLLAIKKIVV